MSVKGSTSTLAVRHRTLRCLQCGAGVAAASSVHAECCGSCGCDFLARPPRSYAEMEGLHDEPIEVEPAHLVLQQQRVDAVATRWVVLLGAVALAGLAALAAFFLLAV